jgi:hypothetical protein
VSDVVTDAVRLERTSNSSISHSRFPNCKVDIGPVNTYPIPYAPNCIWKWVSGSPSMHLTAHSTVTLTSFVHEDKLASKVLGLDVNAVKTK